MPEPIPLHDIILDAPKDSATEKAWARQQHTARAVTERFARGIDTVLLADEVGMGKTYAALAVMAGYLFQSDTNDRKVLLVTPPSSVLRVKWQQEIQSFNEHYLVRSARAHKGMQPITINNYWDLFRNLKDFTNHTVGRVKEETRLCFTWCMFNWAFARGLLGKKRRILWASIDDLHRHDLRIVNFLSQNSEHAIWRFLDEDYGQRAHFYKGLFRSLQDLSFDGSPREGSPRYNRAHVTALFKRFASEQDRHEPNVYIIGMNALTRPRIDHTDNKFLSKYLLAHLMSRRHSDTWKAHAKILVDANILPDKHAHRWKDYVESMGLMAGSEFYGLRQVVIDLVNKPDIQEEWRPLSDAIMRGDASGAQTFFNNLGNLVFAAQLARANIKLAVIDEVHNWKGGAYGAQYFHDHFAPGIQNKLIMSATPFQMEEGEMARLFAFVQARSGGSEEVMQALYASNGEIPRCLATSTTFGKAWQALSLVPAEARRLSELFNTADLDASAALITDDHTESEEIRQFATDFLAYRASIRALQDRLGQVVIRHTKTREKRNFHIGNDFFEQPKRGNHRTALYPAEGYANEAAALVNFIGMRLGQLVQREENKSFESNADLLGGLTSSTAAFRASARKLGKSPATQAYRDMFERILGQHTHPKVEATVKQAFDNFEDGRKTLIFCERVATLKEIEDALKTKIDGFISAQGSATTIERRNLLKRRDLLENLWWHSLWEALNQRATGEELLARYLSDAQAFAIHCLAKAGVHHSDRRIINLLDTWLIGHAYADGHLTQNKWKSVLEFFALMSALLEEECQRDDFPILRVFLAPSKGKQAGNDETGEGLGDHEEEEISTTKDDLAKITSAVEAVIRDQYIGRRNLWLMEDDLSFHDLIWQLLDDESLKLSQRNDAEIPSDQKLQSAMVFYDVLDDLMTGVRKIILRDDLLVRYEHASQADTPFARITEGLRSMRIGHDNSMLERVTRFLTNMVEADGSISRADLTQSKRRSMWQGVFVGQTESVETLDGSTPMTSRAGLCAAFNSPLLPDILICTSIGSEGIDLHRQCADVIHHDLPWNPAKLEQRNGRVDRVGSLAQMSDRLSINIGIPFLADNYEQYQYQKVYSRAQKFEVLLGQPEFDVSDIEEEDFRDENGEKILPHEPNVGGNDTPLRPLPEALVEALRLDLSL